MYYCVCVILGYGLGILLIAAIGIYFYYPWFVRRFKSRGILSRILFHAETNENKIALTIDDVPYKGSSDNINRIGEYLQQNNVPVNYFVMGDYLRKLKKHSNPTVMIQNANILLCNHSLLTYSDLWKDQLTQAMMMVATNEHIEMELERSKRSVEARGKYYRPPSGLCNKEIIDCAERLGMKVTLGDVYPFDAWIPIPRLNAWKVLRDVRPGSIIILHDRSWTLAALQTIVPRLLADGYKFCTLDELTKSPN